MARKPPHVTGQRNARRRSRPRVVCETRTGLLAARAAPGQPTARADCTGQGSLRRPQRQALRAACSPAKARRGAAARRRHLGRESLPKKYFAIELYQGEEHHFRQAARGRPGPNTRYVRKTRKFWQVRFPLDDAAIEYEGQQLRTFEPELTELQKQVLDLLAIPRNAYRSAP